MKRQDRIERKNIPATVAKLRQPTSASDDMEGSFMPTETAGHHFAQISVLRPQAKVAINRPGDTYEQEADSVAEKVMKTDSSEEDSEMEPDPNSEEEKKRVLVAEPPKEQKQEQEAAADPEKEKVQLKRDSSDSSLVSRKEQITVPDADDLTTMVSGVVGSGGQALNASTRAFMEPRFGHDFSRVRVHTDDKASASALAIRARAYTLGRDIVFRSGEYAPGTSEGRRLLAHELTHVVQQRTGSGAIQREPDGWSGPSYARQGPPGSVVDQRRAATASPAAFTAEHDNSCMEGAKKIAKGIESLYTVAADIEKRADSGSMWKANDKDLLALAKQVKDLAKGLQGMKEGFDTLRKKGFDFSKTNFSEEPELPKTLDLLRGSIDSVSQAVETNAALADFQANPSRKTANAWATQVTKQFSAAKGILGAVKLPPGMGWIKEYWEGLLGAPAAYVGAFQEIANRRYDELDKEVGISDESKQLLDTATGKVKWTGGGPVQDLVANAYTAPNGLKLYNWLIGHNSMQGLDLQKNPPLALAKAVIIAGINDDKEVAPEDKTKWTAWIGAFQPAQPA
jgi:hypothetical protein